MTNNFDIFTATSPSEIEVTAKDGRYFNFVIGSDGTLEVSTAGDYDRCSVWFTKEQASEVIVAIQAWIERLEA